MRRKKHKHARRAIRFFKVTGGFREPYKIIVDGNFVHALTQQRMGEPSEALQKLVGGAVKMSTTPCILSELKGLGADFSKAYQTSRKLLKLTCQHQSSPIAPSDCIMSLIGDSNTEHFFVASQDVQLRGKLKLLPAGASIFASVNGIHLEAPSPEQKLAAGQVEKEQMRPTARDAAASEEAGVAVASQRPRDRPALKRRGPKGPNPLSVKKKSTKRPAAPAVPAPTDAVSPAATTASGLARRRNRARRPPKSPQPSIQNDGDM